VEKLTIKDIAKKAGVSVTSVSFVINNKPGISESTREKVQRIIKETNFKPNLNSKKLVLNKSFNICLIMNRFSSLFDDLFYFEIMRGIINKSMKCNYNVIISKAVNSQNELPDLIYSGDADGIIFMQNVSDTLLEKASDSSIPFVVIDSHLSDKNVTSINPNYRKATYDATTYLINHGHTDIAIISKHTPGFYEQTVSGFYDAMKAHKLVPNSDFNSLSAVDESSAYSVAKALFQKANPPTAVLCTVDSFAIGVMRAAKDMKLSIPEDVSIIGIDDILLSRYIEPKLTTLGVDKEAIGSLAMDIIIKKIKGKEVDSLLLPMDLIVRDSVSNRTI